MKNWEMRISRRGQEGGRAEGSRAEGSRAEGGRAEGGRVKISSCFEDQKKKMRSPREYYQNNQLTIGSGHSLLL